jgi:hypothetical protein
MSADITVKQMRTELTKRVHAAGLKHRWEGIVQERLQTSKHWAEPLRRVHLVASQRRQRSAYIALEVALQQLNDFNFMEGTTWPSNAFHARKTNGAS